MTNNDEDTSRQAESLWRSDDWADLRWAREHSTPQQIARHLLDPQWRNRDYNALDELVEMTHGADLSSLSEDDLETLAASGLPELRQSVIRYKDTPARLLEDMARTESNTRLLQMLVESGRLSQNTIDLCCWNQTDSRLAASMLPKASDHLLVRLSGRDWWPSRKNAVESGRLDRARLSEMIEKENHPDVVSALIGTGEFDMDGEAKAIRRVITSPDLLTAYINPMGRRYNLDRPDREVIRQAARTMLEHAPIGLILSMPDDDNENWRTLIDTAATEYADEINPNMFGLIAQAEGNNQAKTILGERLGEDTLSGTAGNQTPTASPGTGGTYEFFGTTPSTSAAAASDEKEPKPVESNGLQIVFASLSSDRGMPEGAVNLLDDDAAQQVSDILSDTGKTTEARNDPSDNEREQRRGNINRLLDVLPVTMVTNDGSHRVDADEIMAATDRTERHDATAVETEEPETFDTATDADTMAEPFDWNGVGGLDASIRDWYVHEFPDYPEGEHIDSQVTFATAIESFPKGGGHDFYEATGVTDSIVRERVFEELSKRLDCEYSDIYDAWLRHDELDLDLRGTKSARMRHDIEDMLGGDAESFATVDAIADRMASNPRLRAVIREADRFIAIGSHIFETDLKDAIGDQPRIERLMDDDRFTELVYDMVHDERRFDASGHVVTVTAETLWAPDEFQSMMELITRVSDRLADNANVRTIMEETTSTAEAAEAGLGQLIDDEIDVISHEDPDMARTGEDEYVTDGRFAQTVYRRLANIQSERSGTVDNGTGMTDVPMPDPCIDPSDDVSTGPGIGM